jgi:sn-glycerol 3-phosphate transport system ATP-binding protein
MAEIELRGLTKSFGRTTVLHGIDLAVAKGEFVVLLGPSGCGKSTLLRLVAGLETATAGEIRIGGEVVNRREPRERGCAMVFQNYALYPHMSVAENIGYSLRVAGLGRAERRARVEAVAATLALTDFLGRKPGELSGGQRQRVAMGRAMIREPRVFLYDEPLSNLDARLRIAMRVEIRRLHQRLGTTTLFVTHDQVEAMTLADRIVVMEAGRIEQVGTPQEVYGRPLTTHVAGFIGSPGMNLVPCRADPLARELVLADGQRLPLEPALAGAAPAGPVIAGFRAEAVELRDDGPLAATLEFAEELGAQRQLHLALGGEAVIALSAGGPVPAPGTRLRLALPPGALHLFDPAGGRRLGTGRAPAAATRESAAEPA